MLQFLQQNGATILTLLAVLLLVFLAIRRIVKDKKAGIGPCGEKCSECAHAEACGRAPAPDFAESEAPLQQTAQCSGVCNGCPYSAQCRK